MKRNSRKLLNVSKSELTSGSLFKMVLNKNTCAARLALVNYKSCAVVVFLFVFFLQTGNFLYAQTNDPDTLKVSSDTTVTDKKKDKKIKKPTIPWKAALMSGFVPGLGQVYNRKYWKVPIVWGALGVTGYFLVDQQIKYVQFRDAYRSWANDSIILPGFEQYSYNPNGLRTQRDNFERSRNILTIVAAVLWTLNIVDAAVDAHLSTFDVGPDLSMRIQPGTFTTVYQNQPAVGLTFTFTFR